MAGQSVHENSLQLPLNFLPQEKKRKKKKKKKKSASSFHQEGSKPGAWLAIPVKTQLGKPAPAMGCAMTPCAPLGQF